MSAVRAIFRPIKTVLFILITLSVSGRAYSGDIKVEAYLSKSSYAYPELNVIVFNNDAKENPVTIDFGTAAYLGNKNSCTFQKPEKNPLREVENSFLGGNYSTYESLSSHALLPPRGFVHRYYPFGLKNYKYPCVVQYKILSESGETIKSAEFTLTDSIDYSVSPIKVALGDLETDFIVEKNLRESGALATLKIRNKTSSYVSLKVLEKRLINCKVGFDYEHPVRQGMDGSIINIAPNANGVILTSVRTGNVEPKNSNCHLQLTIANSNVVGGGEIGKISIPFKSRGEYAATFFAD